MGVFLLQQTTHITRMHLCGPVYCMCLKLNYAAKGQILLRKPARELDSVMEFGLN